MTVDKVTITFYSRPCYTGNILKNVQWYIWKYLGKYVSTSIETTTMNKMPEPD